MSDPVTNMQIEDVLSSIRKLVSEEVRAQTRPRPAGAGAPAASGKLILTPAQRVPEEEVAEDPVESEYGGGAASAEFDMDAFSRDLASDDASGAFDAMEETSLSDEPVTGAPDAAEPLFVHGRRPARATTAGQSLRSLARAGGYEDEGANAGSPLDISDYAESDASLRPRAGHDAAGAGTDELSDEDDHDDLIVDAPKSTLAPIPSFLRSRGIGSLSERLAAVPADAEDEALTWEDREPDTAMFDPVPEELDGDLWAAAGADDEASEQEMMIDEEILRDMVSEIVRQELQGALGERITRNVRKLVRREIQRALAAHDLL